MDASARPRDAQDAATRRQRDHTVHVEAVSAELAVTQPREIALYVKPFQELTMMAVYGEGGRLIIESGSLLIQL